MRAMEKPERPFDREDPFTWASATEEDLATLTPEERAAFDAVMGNRPDELPPGPWAWREVTPFSASTPYAGEALVAGDGGWIAWSESGYGVVETSHPAVKELFARAWALAAAPKVAGHLFTHDPGEHPSDCLDAVLHELAFETNLTGAHRRETFEHGEQALRELRKQVGEARAWARGYEHRLFLFDTSHPPQWLTAPLQADWEGELEFLPEAQERPSGRQEAPSGPPPAPGRLLDADLNQEDDDGNGYTLVDLDSFDPSWLFPGAVTDAGRDGAHATVTVIRTELFETTGGRTVVLVTFDKGH